MPTINKGAKPANKSVNRAERIKVYNSSRWKKLRIAKLMKDPLCEMCLQKGITTPGIDVHHIISFLSTDDPIKRVELAFDYDNLMSICKQCHQKEHNVYK